MFASRHQNSTSAEFRSSTTVDGGETGYFSLPPRVFALLYARASLRERTLVAVWINTAPSGRITRSIGKRCIIIDVIAACWPPPTRAILSLLCPAMVAAATCPSTRQPETGVQTPL